MKGTNIDEFDYTLPDECIARYPVTPRHDSKLLVYRQGEIVSDRYFNLPNHLQEQSLLIINNSKVIEARLHFRKSTGGQVEVFCLEHGDIYPDVSAAMQQKGRVEWICQIGGVKKWKGGPIELQFESNGKQQTLYAEQLQRLDSGFKILFNWTDPNLCFAEILHLAGKIPLPPYLNRETEESDKSNYQTVYAKEDGSVAAPTAGLHLTEELFKCLNAKNIEAATLTLHVGAGTFKPVKAKTAEEHEMHGEFIEVRRELLNTLLEHPEQTRIAVGTTSLRTLESIYWMGVKLLQDPHLTLQDIQLTQWEAYTLPQEFTFSEALKALLQQFENERCDQLLSKTSMMIKPGYRIRSVDAILTNFHQPRSTLLLLIHAFVGNDWRKIYDYALVNNYRFLSYGDGSLLWLKK
ncbi:MAG: S-adenosylmethionine:tRNA ribosyltransferase-isomerase [Flavobacteriia bacterium]|jgi:S-adenosylmethionine:tRNA ribosyltransferase-isomerase